MKEFLSKLVHFIKIEAIFILITMGIVAIITLLKCKRLNLELYKNILSYVGCGYMIVGVMPLLSNNKLKTDRRYWEDNNKFLKKDYTQISEELVKSTDKSFVFLVRSGIIGLVLIIISFFI